MQKFRNILRLRHKLIGFLLCFLVSLTLAAQNDFSQTNESAQYRVIAIQNGDTTVQSISNSVELYSESMVVFPNAFSPDGDGLNDRFGAIGKNLENVEFKIFNRWGELLFEGSSIEDRWDGIYKGKRVGEDVYVYTFSAREIASRREVSKTGTISVVR